jgi:hypothetical protein
MSDENLPVVTDQDLRSAGLPSTMQMSPGLAIFFNEAMYQRCKYVALRMSEAEGIVGKHLIGKPSACLAILSRAITWNLDPFAVAQSTYQTPGGSIGYEGKLIQAILENCGAIEGRVLFEYIGDWNKLRGKFRMKDTQRGGKIPEATWAADDEEGLGVRVIAQVKGEAQPRSEEFFLSEFQPRNSPLWATRPRQQICYASVRAFANIAAPGLIMGIPFDVDPAGMSYADSLQDITPPAPQRSEFQRHPARTDQALGDWIARLNHAEGLPAVASVRAEGLKELPEAMHKAWNEACDGRGRQIGNAEHPNASAPPEAEPEQEQSGNAPQTEAETPATQASEPLLRGTTLLAKLTKMGDVNDLRDTISEELSGEEATKWMAACAAKIDEISNAAAKKKPK